MNTEFKQLIALEAIALVSAELCLNLLMSGREIKELNRWNPSA